MKTIKIFCVGLLVMSISSYGYAQADFFSTISKYLDSNIAAEYQKALAANNADPNGMPESGFLIEYTEQHPEYSQAYAYAQNQAMQELGITSVDQLADATIASIDKLEANIDANDKLTDEEKADMKAKLERYRDSANQMKNQLASTETGGGGGGGGGGDSQPQMPDLMQMIMKILGMAGGAMSGGGGG